VDYIFFTLTKLYIYPVHLLSIHNIMYNNNIICRLLEEDYNRIINYTNINFLTHLLYFKYSLNKK